MAKKSTDAEPHVKKNAHVDFTYLTECIACQKSTANRIVHKLIVFLWQLKQKLCYLILTFTVHE